MTLQVIYDPKSTGRIDFRMRPNAIGHHAAFVEVFGDKKIAVENSGSDFTGVASGAPANVGEVAVDFSAEFDDVTYLDPKAAALGAGSGQHVFWSQKPAERVIEHGAVTSGPFVIGDTLTGGTSGATANVVGVGAGFLQIDTIIGGPFAKDEVITGSGGATATVTSAGELNQRRFAYIQFKDFADAFIPDATLVSFTYEVRGVSDN